MIRRHATPALFIFLSILISCLARPFLAGHVWPFPAAAGVAAALGVTLMHIDVPRMKRAGLLALCACLGFLLGSLAIQRINLAGGGVIPLPIPAVSGFTGILTEDSSLSKDSRTVLRVSLIEVRSDGRGVSTGARGRILAFVTGDYRFALGQKLFFRTTLRPSASPVGRESYVSFVERRDIRSLGFINPVWEIRARTRESIHRSIGMAGFPASALLEALLVGGREDIPADLVEGFQKTGSTHILALSGLHAAILFGIISLVLRFTSNRAAKYLLGVMALALYQFIAGPLPSLLRATLMLAIGGAALLFDRDGEPVNILALSGIVILVADPFQAYNLSFQLSYIALFGLLAVAPSISRGLAGWIPPALLASVSVSAAAQLATFPVVAGSFGVYYPSGLIASLVLVPLTTVFLWMGLLWLFVSPLIGPLVHQAAAASFNSLYIVISSSADILAGFPGLRIAASIVPWAASGGFAAFLVLCLLPLGMTGGTRGALGGALGGARQS